MSALRARARSLCAELWPGSAFPAALDAALDRLERSAWPEIVTTWSRLTPSGFPVEFTAGPPGSPPRWTTELAGPELPESGRLAAGAALLAMDGPAVPPDLLDALSCVQRGTPLGYGAWLGGGTTNRKVYAELPGGCVAGLPLPGMVRVFLRGLPPGAVPRMLAVDPAARRVEVYAGLPDIELTELASLFHEIGCPGALRCLGWLPDGLGRVRGRRPGLSVAAGLDGSDVDDVELALFVTARTLFPGSPELLPVLAPQISGVTPANRVGPVTMRLDPHGGPPAIAVGLTPAPTARRGARVSPVWTG